ncbi:MAG: putative transposase [Chthoniobacteraceae bacterium]|nr:putative transposase [Chthoniobacteraceae bacterium]
MTERKQYPSDVSDDEWAFVVPYLTLMKEDAPQREHPLREVFNAMRWIVRAGAPWRMMPTNFPPYYVVYQQTQRWLKAGVFEDVVHDLRVLLRLLDGRNANPTAGIIDSRTLHGSIENGDRGGYNANKKKKGSKLHMVVDVLGNLLAAHVTPANEQDRAQVGELAKKVQEATGENVEVMFADQGYSGEEAAAQTAEHGIRLEVVKRPEGTKALFYCLGAG